MSSAQLLKIMYDFFSTLTGFKEFSNILSDLARLRHIYNIYILIRTALDVNIMSYCTHYKKGVKFVEVTS